MKKIIYVIVSLLLLSGCTNKEPEKPKTLVETIALSIKEHTSDWTFTPVDEKHNATLGEAYTMYAEIWENKKCGIKINAIHSFMSCSLMLISPDTLQIDEYEAEKEIQLAYYNAVQLPQIIIDTRIKDSLAMIKKKKAADKEAKILSKICTQQ